MVRGVLLCWLARMTSARAGVALVYHRVGGQGGNAHLEILAAVSDRAFAKQLRHLARHYRIVPAGDLLDAVRSRRRGERFPVAITFDDDLAGHIHAALPALQRERVRATFFLGGYSLAGPHSFWWEDLQLAVDGRLVSALPHVPDRDLHDALARSPKAIFRVAAAIESLEPGERSETSTALRDAVAPARADAGLRPVDVKALVAAGMEVGFHTVRHEALPALSDDGLERALREGREELARVSGRPIDLIAYPHGKADARVADAARTAGFRIGFTTARAPVRADSDPLLVPRMPPALSAGKTALRVARAVAPWS
jgi:peptidoglycan/xylan/chitin deacetylase (PgdA/CDA1 family)